MNPPPGNELLQRQNPASGVHVQLGQSNIILLTINTEKREPWLANKMAHQFLRETWSEATAWLIGDYLLEARICVEAQAQGMEIPIAWMASSAARRRELFREMDLCSGKSVSQRIGSKD
jgi:hypothetical protein